ATSFMPCGRCRCPANGPTGSPWGPASCSTGCGSAPPSRRAAPTPNPRWRWCETISIATSGSCVMKNLPEQKLYIDGGYEDASSGETFEDVNPATGDVICRVQVANDADVDRAVAAAERGFREWSALTGAQRGRILMNAVRLLRERNRELAELEVLDTGKPISEAVTVDVLSGADAIEYYAGVAASLHGHHYDLGPSAFAYTRREPLGVCAGI